MLQPSAISVSLFFMRRLRTQRIPVGSHANHGRGVGPFPEMRTSCDAGLFTASPEPSMATALQWTDNDEETVPASFPSSQHFIRGRRTPARPDELPPEIEAAIWRGTELGSPVTSPKYGLRRTRRRTPRRWLAAPLPDPNPSAPAHGCGVAPAGAGNSPSCCQRRKHRRGRPTEVPAPVRPEVRRSR